MEFGCRLTEPVSLNSQTRLKSPWATEGGKEIWTGTGVQESPHAWDPVPDTIGLEINGPHFHSQGALA